MDKDSLNTKILPIDCFYIIIFYPITFILSISTNISLYVLDLVDMVSNLNSVSMIFALSSIIVYKKHDGQCIGSALM